MTKQSPRPDVGMFLAFLNSVPGPQMHEMPLAEARAAYVAMTPMADADPTPLAVIKDIMIPGPAGNIPARFYDALETRDAGHHGIFPRRRFHDWRS